MKLVLVLRDRATRACDVSSRQLITVGLPIRRLPGGDMARVYAHECDDRPSRRRAYGLGWFTLNRGR
jgi:hypothetical protein